jgi:hypothetical protein
MGGCWRGRCGRQHTLRGWRSGGCRRGLRGSCWCVVRCGARAFVAGSWWWAGPWCKSISRSLGCGSCVGCRCLVWWGCLVVIVIGSCGCGVLVSWSSSVCAVVGVGMFVTRRRVWSARDRRFGSLASGGCCWVRGRLVVARTLVIFWDFGACWCWFCELLFLWRDCGVGKVFYRCSVW